MSVSIQLTILVIKMNDAEIRSDRFIAIVQMVINKVLEVDVSIVLIWTNVPRTVTTSVTKMPGATILMDHMNVIVMLDTMGTVSHAPISTNVNKKPRTSSVDQTDSANDFRGQLLAKNIRDMALYGEARQLYLARKNELNDGP